MGKKTNCCKKKSSKHGCDDSSNSLTSDSSFSSSTYGFCCPKYPKCRCVVNKCAPIYYPNNCVGQYPYPQPITQSCPPFSPCPPFPCPPCPPFPCPPTQCGLKYTSNNNIITSSSTLNVNSPNVFICNPSSDIILTLPQISSLSSCGYTKMFVISNISSTYTVTINPAAGDNLTNNTISVLGEGDSITLYSVNVSGGAYWVVA